MTHLVHCGWSGNAWTVLSGHVELNGSYIKWLNSSPMAPEVTWDCAVVVRPSLGRYPSHLCPCPFWKLLQSSAAGARSMYALRAWIYVMPYLGVKWDFQSCSRLYVDILAEQMKCLPLTQALHRVAAIGGLVIWPIPIVRVIICDYRMCNSRGKSRGGSKDLMPLPLNFP